MRIQRSLAILLALVPAATGCGPRAPTSANPDVTTPATAAASAADPAAESASDSKSLDNDDALPERKKRAMPTEPPVTAEARAAYLKHLRAGRAFAKATKWGEATRSFEAALAAMPMDARALSELGWAAFQTGDYAKAKTANESSVKLAIDANVKAASLYNLGRVAEAGKDIATATAHYQASLQLRQNKTVAERLKKLGAAPKAAELSATPSKCLAAMPRLDDVCNCLIADEEPNFEGEKIECVATANPDHANNVSILEVKFSMTESEFYLAYKSADGYQAIADLGYLYAGGIGGVWNDFEVAAAYELPVGKAKLLRINTVRAGYDHDLGIDESENYAATDTILCVLSVDGKPQMTCPLKFTNVYTYTRDRLNMLDGEELDDLTKSMQTPGLPIERAYELRDDISADGTVTIVLHRGNKQDAPAEVLGPHRLW